MSARMRRPVSFSPWNKRATGHISKQSKFKPCLTHPGRHRRRAVVGWFQDFLGRRTWGTPYIEQESGGMSAQSQRVSFRQDKPFNPRKRQKLPHPMDSSFLTRGKNDLMQRGKSDLIRTRVHRVLEISRPADRRDAIYRTREWGDVGPKSKWKHSDHGCERINLTSSHFLGAAGDKSPWLYREQGLWNHLSKILGRQGTEYIVYREQGFQKCGIVDKRKWGSTTLRNSTRNFLCYIYIHF